MKRLVVCCDGTWYIPDRLDRGRVCPGNVAKMALAVAARDAAGTPQALFYDRGVGTGASDRITGGLFGCGLTGHILNVYRFLIDEYEDGDEIFLFGFSRGAYTARSVAGLIRNSGILRRRARRRISEAYDLYRRRDDASHPAGVEATIFRRQFAREAPIRFIGVWDTVGSLGIPVRIPWLPVSWLHFINRRWEFHDVKLSSIVQCAAQALAIDERRPQFAPTLWEQQPHARAGGQRLEQVWFAGTHANVGGGYADSGLSDLAFQWLAERAAACGLALDEAYIRDTIRPDALGELRESRTGVYRLFPAAMRRLGEGPSGNEAAHASAVRRVEHAGHPPYRPRNLLRYLHRGGVLTAG